MCDQNLHYCRGQSCCKIYKVERSVTTVGDCITGSLHTGTDNIIPVHPIISHIIPCTHQSIIELISYRILQYEIPYQGLLQYVPERGTGIAQWLERRTRDWKVAGSNPCLNGVRIFSSRVNFLCWLLFRYPFHPRVTTVARKRSRSFCQKCRWQVTGKHAYTLRMWLCMKWHGTWL